MCVCVCVCVCVCRWIGAKLKAGAKAKRREECSTKGACVLQLGLCVYMCASVCVFVDRLECLCHGASQTFACEGCPKIDKHWTAESLLGKRFVLHRLIW